MCVLSQIKPQRRRPKKIGGVLKNQEGEEERGACALQNCEVVGSHLGLQAAPKAVVLCTSYAP